MTAEEKRAYDRDYYQRRIKGSAKQKERYRKLWAKEKMRMMVDADHYAEHRRRVRASQWKWRRKKGMKVRGLQPARTIPDWCVMGCALDANSPLLFENASPELKAYGRQLATEWAAKRRRAAR